jgi:hypothetical protein
MSINESDISIFRDVSLYCFPRHQKGIKLALIQVNTLQM